MIWLALNHLNIINLYFIFHPKNNIRQLKSAIELISIADLNMLFKINIINNKFYQNIMYGYWKADVGDGYCYNNFILNPIPIDNALLYIKSAKVLS